MLVCILCLFLAVLWVDLCSVFLPCGAVGCFEISVSFLRSSGLICVLCLFLTVLCVDLCSVSILCGAVC